MQMMMMFDVEGVTVGRETSTATTSSSPRILLVFLLRMARAAPRAAARERERLCFARAARCQLYQLCHKFISLNLIRLACARETARCVRCTLHIALGIITNERAA